MEDHHARHQADPGGHLQKDEALSQDLALFDFDGTITRRDSFLDFIKFYHGRAAFYRGFAALLPVLVLYKLKIIPNWQAKEKVLTWFFKNEPFEAFQRRCDAYAEVCIPAIVRPSALEKIKEHLEKGDEVYLISASAENWLAAWCRKVGIKLIGTHLQVKEGRITGKLKGYNCYGEEKVNRIRSLIALHDYHKVYAYGDSPGDRDMLTLADFPNYRVF